MFSSPLRIVFVLAVFGMAIARGQAPALRVQPGLEAAVKWKWSVVPSGEKEWGFPPSEATTDPKPGAEGEPSGKNAAGAPTSAVSIAPGDYEVKRGDALAKISKKAGITVDQLKSFNALPDDTIHIGQVLKIPTLQELLAIVPPRAVPVAGSEVKEAKKAPPKEPSDPVAEMEAEATLFQVFLDRENFTSGPIDGNRGAVFEEALTLYRGIHPDLATPETVREKALAVAERPYTSYRLKRSDFRFIEVSKDSGMQPVAPPKTKGAKPGAATKAPPLPAPTYEELVAATFSTYRTPWEFIAERFHCDEAFLRNLNPRIKEPVAAGIEFKVPNVIPFEVENCLTAPLQPAADPAKPVTAAIIGFSRLEIRRGDQLIAVMPVSRARPDLRGKGTWTVLAAIPAPRLATRQESTVTPKPAAPGTPPPPADPVAPALAADQFLAAGPRNPVGICWINLAKANSTTPLPYGLHGTAIPSRMKTYESIGGFRMTNWDIARAVRLLPEGTPLHWK
ncbi:MAG: LysM peptidoglycan-binding domain-containing protein [Luteolibacter sp.]|uniref:LysM peptidoglycan-binding domain-containing protein n=1 Tax=Luteolibacter sp. TaxID=1962973 RepID=UPI0032677FB0